MTERLYRSRRDRMLAGVAGGLAEMWDVDPSLVRIAWALLVILTGGIAFLVYIVMAIVVPEEDDGTGAWSKWPTPPPPPGAPSAPAAPGTDAAAAGGAAPGGAADASAALAAPAAFAAAAGTTPAPGAPSPWTSPYGSRDEARAAWRDAREARRAARGERGIHGSAIFGIILVGVGIWFLAREWLPQLDFDWFWPLILVGIGVVLLVSALSRRPDDPGGAS